MDLAFIYHNHKINIRVGLILTYQEEILFLKKMENDYYVLPGGHVKFGEKITESIQREIKEELGLDINPTYFTFLENFYEKKVPVHEYFFIFEMSCSKKLNMPKTKEGKEELFWIKKDKIKELNIYPASLKDLLIKS